MKTTIRLFLCFVLMGNSSCFAMEQGIPRTLNVRVIGEDGEPIQGAEAKIGFRFVGSTKGLTDAEGRISHFGRQKGSWFVGVNKEGYYHTGGLGPMAAPPDPVEVVLKRKIDPVPMVVGQVPNTSIPERDKVIKYDLEKADWLPPHGSGKIADLYFRVREPHFQKGGHYRAPEWEVIGEMWVENPGDGFVLLDRPEANTPTVASELASPQQAPVSGYDQTKVIQENRQRSNRAMESIDPRRTLIVFRVRTKLDDKGNVKSAHYGKIYYPMMHAPGGDKGNPLIGSIFYFNPAPNNRSLEFNKDNLNPNPPSRGFPY